MKNLWLNLSELIFKVRYWLAPEEKKLELTFSRMKKHADALGWGYMFDGVDPKELAKAIYSLNMAFRSVHLVNSKEEDNADRSV